MAWSPRSAELSKQGSYVKKQTQSQYGTGSMIIRSWFDISAIYLHAYIYLSFLQQPESNLESGQQ